MLKGLVWLGAFLFFSLSILEPEGGGLSSRSKFQFLLFLFYLIALPLAQDIRNWFKIKKKLISEEKYVLEKCSNWPKNDFSCITQVPIKKGTVKL
jgi:hypothetical protein